ncbi:unnamed protein product [Notodromas monacha]|uniref:Mediator of RNA polymerase II transcription subunit 7 n=1 Tax=Notodromas monacha TaxID=399045 RepID=A0A7R9BE29_9CRUS|nr:unnamed protein product [Notodromas monacha]CAG0912749.1 unnamed protein product [Notodromas monacha]
MCALKWCWSLSVLFFSCLICLNKGFYLSNEVNADGSDPRIAEESQEMMLQQQQQIQEQLLRNARWRVRDMSGDEMEGVGLRVQDDTHKQEGDNDGLAMREGRGLLKLFGLSPLQFLPLLTPLNIFGKTFNSSGPRPFTLEIYLPEDKTLHFDSGTEAATEAEEAFTTGVYSGSERVYEKETKNALSFDGSQPDDPHQTRKIHQSSLMDFNADIRDSMIGLHTALTELKEKFEKHDVREKTTANSLLNSVRRIASATKTMETVAVNLGRMDVRLANLERMMTQQEEKQINQISKMSQAIESLVVVVNARLPESISARSSAQMTADLSQKINSIETKLDNIQNLAEKEASAASRTASPDSDVSATLRDARNDIAFIKDEVVIINDALKTSAVVSSSGGADPSKVLEEIAGLKSKLATVSSGLDDQGKRIAQLYDDSTELMEAQLSKLMELEKNSLKQGGVLVGMAEQTESILSALPAHNETIVELNKLRYGVESTGEISNKIISLLSTKPANNGDTGSDSHSSEEVSEQLEELQQNITKGYKELSNDVKDLGKTSKVLLSTADDILSIRRSVEIAVQKINFEMGTLIKTRSDDIKSSVLEEIDEAKSQLLFKLSGQLKNSTTSIQEEVSQVWRQIGILYSQMTSSQAMLETVRNQTTSYVDGSLSQVGEMNSRVGQVSTHMAEVQDNLNYLLGRLSLVASEFSRMKNTVGDELQNIRADFGKIKSGKDFEDGDSDEDKGPGPFPIIEAPDQVPSVDLNTPDSLPIMMDRNGPAGVEPFCVRPGGRVARPRGRRGATGSVARRFRAPDMPMQPAMRPPLALRGAVRLPCAGPSMPTPKKDLSNLSFMPPPPMQYISAFSEENVKKNRLPRPPFPDETYRMFGNIYNIDDAIVKPLEVQNIKRLYPQNFDHKKELKKLNCSILVNLLDLLDILARCPEAPKRKEKIEEITLLFLHMHHLVNEFRPHQARESLKAMLTQQREQRTSMAESFDRHVDRVLDILRQTLAMIPSISRKALENGKARNLPPESHALAKLRIEKTPDNGTCIPHDKIMCDFIDSLQS